jgi:serine/threonine protein kinase
LSTNKLILKIIDFGIAGVQAGVHTDNDNPGSLKYLPPEALRKLENAVGPWWDI